MAKVTQGQAILKLLREAGERGVDNYTLNGICFRYGARLHDLKSAGYNIESKHLKGSRWVFILHTQPVQQSLFKVLDT